MNSFVLPTAELSSERFVTLYMQSRSSYAMPCMRQYLERAARERLSFVWDGTYFRLTHIWCAVVCPGQYLTSRVKDEVLIGEQSRICPSTDPSSDLGWGCRDMRAEDTERE